MHKWFRNSGLVKMICNQINKMPPVVVGVLTACAYVGGVIMLAMAGALAFILFIGALGFAIEFFLNLPLGVGVAILGAGFQIGLWNLYKKAHSWDVSMGHIVKKSVKVWSLAWLLGYLTCALIAGSLYLSNPSSDNFIVGIRILFFGWVVVGATKLPKLFHLLPGAYSSFESELKAMGLNSLKKCSEVTTSAVE